MKDPENNSAAKICKTRRTQQTNKLYVDSVSIKELESQHLARLTHTVESELGETACPLIAVMMGVEEPLLLSRFNSCYSVTIW